MMQHSGNRPAHVTAPCYVLRCGLVFNKGITNRIERFADGDLKRDDHAGVGDRFAGEGDVIQPRLGDPNFNGAGKYMVFGQDSVLRRPIPNMVLATDDFVVFVSTLDLKRPGGGLVGVAPHHGQDRYDDSCRNARHLEDVLRNPPEIHAIELLVDVLADEQSGDAHDLRRYSAPGFGGRSSRLGYRDAELGHQLVGQDGDPGALVHTELILEILDFFKDCLVTLC